eukprot:86780-Prymnesium_polylepis.1
MLLNVRIFRHDAKRLGDPWRIAYYAIKVGRNGTVYRLTQKTSVITCTTLEGVREILKIPAKSR